MAHGEAYTREYGWDTTFEALVARIVADYANDHDPAARRRGSRRSTAAAPAACSASPRDETTAKLRILLVHPDARGLGLGGRLVDACLDFARAAGYERMELWTNDPLVAARHVYLARGFELTGEETQYSFRPTRSPCDGERALQRRLRAVARVDVDPSRLDHEPPAVVVEAEVRRRRA